MDWRIEIGTTVGGLVVLYRLLKQQVNGIGAKCNAIIGTLVEWADTEEKRKQVAALLKRR